MSISMCDISTRQWCCRIGLVLVVSTVLMTMMFQIWSYYFSLVRDMDDLTVLSPKIGAIVSVFNNSIVKKWNLNCNVVDNHYICENDTYSDSLIFVDSNCNQLNWYEIPITACCRTIIWILPW